jgi:hypothetical protein
LRVIARDVLITLSACSRKYALTASRSITP